MDVVDGSVRSYGRSMVGGPRHRVVRGGDEDAVLVAVGWHGDGWWVRVNRWGPSRGMCTDGEGRKLERANVAQWNDTAGAAGVGVRRDGVVIGCRAPHRAVVG